MAGQIKKTVYLLQEATSEYQTVMDFDMSKGASTHHPYIKLGEQEVVFDLIDRAEIVKQQIAKLEECKEAVRAEKQKDLDALDEKIQKLLCITHDEPEKDDEDDGFPF